MSSPLSMGQTAIRFGRNTINFPATNGGDRGWAITLDASGNVIVVGESWGGTQIPPATGFDYLVLKYSSSGTPVFAQRQTASAGSADDAAQAVATDSTGNIYVTGYALSGAWYIATFCFSPVGCSLVAAELSVSWTSGKEDCGRWRKCVRRRSHVRSARLSHSQIQ